MRSFKCISLNKRNDKEKHGTNWIDIKRYTCTYCSDSNISTNVLIFIFIMLWSLLSTNLNQVTITNIISGEPRSTLCWLIFIITLQWFSIHLIKIYARFIIFILSILLFEFVWLSRFHLPYIYIVKVQADLLLPMQSVTITTDVVSSNPSQARCTRYNIMW